MPDPRHHVVTGRLIRAQGRIWIEADGGGRWDLDWVGPALRRHLGRRVTVIGRRAGFDGLAVEQFSPEGEWPRRWYSLDENRILGLFALLWLIATLGAIALNIHGWIRALSG